MAKVTGKWGMSLLVLGFHLEGPNHAIPWVIQNNRLQSEQPQREEPVPGDRRNKIVLSSWLYDLLIFLGFSFCMYKKRGWLKRSLTSAKSIFQSRRT